VGPDKDHIYLHSTISTPRSCTSASRHHRERKVLPAWTCGASRSRCCRPCTTTWAASPPIYHGEVYTLKDGNPDTIVPGLLAIGEAACVSVHGANRLGSNSLTTWWYLAARLACAAGRRWSAGARCPAQPGCRRVCPFPPPTRRAHAKGGTPTAELRMRMQKTMQSNCAVFRTGEVLEEGFAKIKEIWAGSEDIRVTDRSLIWNST